ncbi:mediator of DNA damage checkpoint protein 1-like isoform X2 [Liolophura sinensis]|uniref:mediator of DNA damage checkpoint protein 1-like isoform X2 n=1 Tax=Liolophura sinensis TaxID=3198878 RepID=UPI003158C45D
MDLDQTQAIVLEDYHDETDEEKDNSEKKPASYLKVFCQKGFPETKFPLYEGDNVIGREQGKCNIYIPIKALSKQHACIEIRGESHLIYDKGSRNKTKWGKLYLTPDVRYGLRDGDEICMADVRCVYQLYTQNEEQYDSGSETGSESMFQTATMATIPDVQDEGRRKFLEATKDEINDEDESSNASSDLLQPTQLYGTALGEKARKGRLNEAATLMFAEDSDLSDMEMSTVHKKKKNITIAETPAVTRAAPADLPSTMVFAESDSEDDRPTQAQTLVFEEDDDDRDKSNSSLLGAPTQAYGADVGSPMEGDTTADGLTLAYDVTFDEADASSALSSKKTRATKEDNISDSLMATQAYGLEVETNAGNINAHHKQSPKKVEELEASETSTQPMQDAEESLSVEPDPDFFAAPTMACDLEGVTPDVSKVPGDSETESEEKSTTGRDSEVTQAFDTVPVEKSTAGEGLESTQAFDTVPVENSTEGEGAESSQAFETVPVVHESPGKPVKDKSPVKSTTNKSVEQTVILSSGDCAETVVMDNEGGVETESGKLKQADATVLMNDDTTQVIEDGDYGHDGMTNTEKDYPIDDDATQVFAEEEKVDVDSGKTDEKPALGGLGLPEVFSDEVVPDSCESEDNTPSAIPLPATTPLKPALASPKKNRTPSPKKVVFVGVSQSSSELSQETKATSGENEIRVQSESESNEVPVVSVVEAEDGKPKLPARRGRGGKSAPKPAMKADKDTTKPGRGRKMRKSAGACVSNEEKIVEDVPSGQAVLEETGTTSEPALPPRRRGRRAKKSSNITQAVKTEQPAQNEEQEPTTSIAVVQAVQSEEQVPADNHSEQSESVLKDSEEDGDFMDSKNQTPVTRKKVEKVQSTRRSRQSTCGRVNVNNMSQTESTGSSGETPVVNNDGGEDFHAPARRGKGKKLPGKLARAKTRLKGNQGEHSTDTENSAGENNGAEVFKEPAASSRRRSRSKASESEDENASQVRTSGRRVAGENENAPQVRTSGRSGQVVKAEQGSDDGAGADSVIHAKATSCGVKAQLRNSSAESEAEVCEPQGKRSRGKGSTGDKETEATGEATPMRTDRWGHASTQPSQSSQSRRSRKAEVTTKSEAPTDEDSAEKEEKATVEMTTTTSRRGRASTQLAQSRRCRTSEVTVKSEAPTDEDSAEKEEKATVEMTTTTSRRGRASTQLAQSRRCRTSEVTEKSEAPTDEDSAEKEEKATVEMTTTTSRRGRASTQLARSRRCRTSEVTEKSEAPTDEDSAKKEEKATVEMTTTTSRRGRASTQPARSRRCRTSEVTEKSEAPSDEDTAEKQGEPTAKTTSRRGRASTQPARSRRCRTSEVTEKSEAPIVEEKSTVETTRRGSKKDTEAELTSMRPPAQRPTQRLASTENSDTTQAEGDSETSSRKGRRSAVKSTPTNAKHRKLSSSSSLTSSPDDPVTDMASPRSSRRKSVGPKPKVAFTGVVDEHGQKITKDLGGELVSSVYECTHLVTDKVRRTVKFLCCLARGLPIVLPQWLDCCKDAGVFIDPSDYIIQDKTSEKQYKFSLRSSIQKASEACLLSGFRVHVTKSVRPDPPQMRDIIQCAGAEYLGKMPNEPGEHVVVVSCEEDKGVCQSALEAGVTVVSSEFLFTGILKQEILIDNFRLFEEKGQRKKRLSTQPGGATMTKKTQEIRLIVFYIVQNPNSIQMLR